MASFYTWSSGNILEPATGLSNGEVTRLKQGLSGSTDTTGLYGVVFTGESTGIAILVQADAAITAAIGGSSTASDPITFTIPSSAIVYRNTSGWLTGTQKTFSNGIRSFTLPPNAPANQYQVSNLEDGGIQTTPWDAPLTITSLNNKGWIDLDGTFRFKFYFIPSSAGYVNVSGNGMYNAYNYTPNGGASLSGSATASTSFIAEFDFEWDVEGEIKLSFDFQWNVGQGVLHYYQIEGECLIADCDRGGVESQDPRCGGSSKQKFIQTIAARNTADLCRKMQDKFLTYPIAWPVLKIKRHSRPAYLDDIRAEEAAGKDHSCNVLEDQDYEDVPDCILFTLKQASRVNMGMNITIQQDFLSQTGSGSYRLYGNSPFTVTKLNGGTINYDEGFSYAINGTGSVILSGAADISSSAFGYTGSGKFQLFGGADFVSPHYTYVGSGSIIMSGLSYSFTPTGGMILSGSATILRGRAYSGAGSMRLSGQSVYDAQNYAFKYEGSGNVSLSGLSDIVSSAWKYTGDGGINLFGSYTNNQTYKSTGLPSLQASGSAPVNYIVRFNGSSSTTGTIIIGGSAQVVSPAQSYIGSGGITLSSQAIIHSSWMGLLQGSMGITSSLNSVEVILSVPTATTPLISSAASVLTECDCRNLGIALGLSHNLGSSQPLSFFLNRNGFKLPSQTSLKYKTNEKTWRNNFNYTGFGTDNQQERWNIIFEWACSNELAGTEQVSYLWKFSLLVQRRNTVTKESADTRILCTFGIETECLQESFDFPFVVNTKTLKFQAPNRSFVDYNLFHDEIGLFKGQPWYKTPNFNVTISELSPDGGEVLYDYTTISPDVNSIPEAAFRTLVTG